MLHSIPLPILKKMRALKAPQKKANHFLQGAYRSSFKGSGIEFEEVRPFTIGDDIRSIDWNVTARLQQPHIKRFQEEREMSSVIIFDVSQSLCFGQKKEALATVAAELILAAAQNQDLVGLLLFSSEIHRYIAPKKGLSHAFHLIHLLFKANQEKGGTDLQKALTFVQRLKLKRSFLFLLSDFNVDFDLLQTDSPLLKKTFLLARHHSLTAIEMRDPREDQLPQMGLVSFKDLESGQIQLIDTDDLQLAKSIALQGEQRRLFQTKLKKQKAKVICLKSDEDYLAKLALSLASSSSASLARGKK